METEELRRRMAALPMPPESRPPEWDYWRADLHNCVMTSEPEDFTKWPVIRHTMLMDHLPIESSWQIVFPHIKHYRNAIAPPVVGVPDWYNGYSRTMVEQCAFVANWEKHSQREITDLDVIVELGGGYGTMALLARRLGFEGKYVIFDFPEMMLFQKWFLDKHDIEVDHITSLDSTKKIYADMLIAIDSISETPFAFRREFLSKTSVSNFLFRYSPTWGDYDNAAYFNNLRAKRGELMWHEWFAKGWVSTGLVGW